MVNADNKKKLTARPYKLKLPPTLFQTEADFDNQKGNVHLVGNLTLNYVKVRCVADINLETLEGKGYLEPIET
ncbi:MULTISPECIES: hypothetical protein [Nostocales]|uniref:hypothetical protein n=1 Tax=Nostocales TaxID=1161 RepID=UPI0004B6A054|nr:MULTISPECIES: hypothetical protein [Nostocales]